MPNQKEEEREQITARILKETTEKLTEGAEKRNLRPATYYALILDKAAKLQTKEGMLIISKQILKDIYGDPQKVEEKAKEHAEMKYEEWKILEGDISLGNFDRRLREWNSISNTHVRVSKNSESITYEVNHGIDKQWSKYQCLLNIGILELMGETVKSHDIRKLSWSIIITVTPI